MHVLSGMGKVSDSSSVRGPDGQSRWADRKWRVRAGSRGRGRGCDQRGGPHRAQFAYLCLSIPMLLSKWLRGPPCLMRDAILDGLSIEDISSMQGGSGSTALVNEREGKSGSSG